ncbi:MAG: PilZ domain-containing protein [Phycisphaerae bacterium]
MWLTVLVRHVALQEERPFRRKYNRESYRYEGDFGAVQVFEPDHVALPGARADGMWAALVQISLGGIMIRSRSPLDVGSLPRLEIALEDEVIHARGVVRHCTDTIGGYKIGIELLFDDEQAAGA